MTCVIDLNNRNTTSTWTADFDCYEVGRTLTPAQRSMFFRIGAEIQSQRAVRLGFLPNVHECHEQALWALETITWKSLKAARALLSVSRQHGAF
jgi:hypothetical protein